MDKAIEPEPEHNPLAGNGEGKIEVHATATVAAPAGATGTVTKVIVAVHGIGDQYNYATIQSVVNQFCGFFKQPAAVPLGSFHNGKDGYVPGKPLERFAFTEVYWAPIARGVVNEKYTLEETKKWARTIVERLRSRWYEEGEKGTCREEDFQLTQQVLGEMIQTIAVLDRVCFLADKAGLFTFDLRKLLDDYLGDVQIVAEFQTHRGKILAAFDELLGKLDKAFPNADFYFVTHSEGTVVALLGLLKAFREENPPRWTEKVRGFMTLGSPIDKHLALWPELFGDAPPSQKALEWQKQHPEKKIEWRNYYDLGDPVGFELDAFREWIEMNQWQGVFNFTQRHDMGFTRYPFPGKAHVDYWTDSDVFKHFISDVVETAPPATEAAKPRETVAVPNDNKGKKWLSYVLPYVGVGALLFIAAYVLYKAVTTAMGYTGPTTNGVQPEKLAYGILIKQVAGLAALLLGITLVARIPRLTRDIRWRALSFALGALGAFAYMWSVHFERKTEVEGFSIPPGGATLGLAILVVILVYVASVKWPSWGLTPMMVLGAVAVAVMVATHLKESPEPLWPVFLATVGFLYLWWLAALLFDLIFIWHLYIRNSRLTGRINEVLGQYKDRISMSQRAEAASRL